MTYTLDIGSVSSGTMLAEDLLSAFSWEIEQIVKHDPDNKSAAKWLQDVAALDSQNDESDWDEQASDLINEAFDILNEYVPPYCYFGAHEGDGSDYGVWPAIDSFEDPKVDDPSELDDLDSDESEALHVNDHGNVTLFARNAAGEWASVWSIV